MEIKLEFLKEILREFNKSGYKSHVTEMIESLIDSNECEHNEMVDNNNTNYAWRCKCGYVYGK